MRIRILGSAAGGGFPQWNCNCANCAGFRKGTLNAKARMQSSIAISDNNLDWILINVSPDIHKQLALFSDLQPGNSLRDTAIKAVILVDSQIDHSSGLLFLREGKAIELYCTDMVRNDLQTGFPVIDVLDFYCGIHHHPINTNQQAFQIEGFSNLEITPILLTGKAPPYSKHRHDPHPGDNIGLLIHDKRTQKNLFYAPGVAQINSKLKSIMQTADCILIDGTFWQEDEMQQAGINNKLAQDMGHLPQSGAHGMISILDELKDSRNILIHINNTNPILDENSKQRAILNAHHIEVAYDGMEIDL